MRWEHYYQSWNMPFLGFLPFAVAGLFLSVLLVWSLYWKAQALWRAARKDDKPWFVALLLINTAGILEILYLYHFSKREK